MKGFCVRSGLARELVKGTNLILEEYKPTRGKKLVISGWAGGWVTWIFSLGGWAGGWAEKIQVSASQLSDLYKIMILLRKSVVAGAGFEPATFGL